MDIKQLRQQVDELFSKRAPFMSLLQEIAENFYPERADFTISRVLGDQFAPQLMTSYPILCRRDLGDQFATMLRDTSKPWFHMRPKDEGRQTNDVKRQLERFEKIQRRAMYDRDTMFTRATKEVDHDFAAFGQGVMSIRTNREANTMLYRSWHIRDVVWMENENGKICFIARKGKYGAREMVRLFRNKNHRQVGEKASKTPFEDIELYHIICEAEMYDGDAKRFPYWSIYYDATHDHLLEAVPTWNKEYMIPRWQTVSGSQYAFSPATIVGLPDARLIQSMAYTLLEAGEKITNPPMIATIDAVRSDVAIYPGGITWVDNEYDEKMGEALRPITQDARGMPIGIEMQRDAREMLMRCFFLNKLNLPQRAPEMTAYEVGQRIQQYIRDAMPIFEPMEQDYNGQLCEMTFEALWRNGAFGPPDSWPRELQGADIEFHFESPLHDAIDQQKGQKFLEMASIIAQAINLDQSVGALPDAKTAVRDVLEAIDVPAKWINSEQTVRDIEKAQQEKQAAAQTLAAMQQGSEVAANLGKASKDFGGAEGGLAGGL